MKRDRTLIRASDIGLWGYCERAWWLARVRGISHQQPERLRRGTAAHQRHGKTVAQAQRYQRWGHRLLALAMMLLGAALLIWLWQNS
ncbi:MAG: hypothetical protein KDE31_35895 [Caldilineaceae bacterium]|nr:hypothetical protein [Caldilineaceae bacterium]